MHQDPKVVEGAGAPLLLTDKQAAHLLCVGLTTFHGLRAEPWFPKPVSLGPRLVRWARSEIEAAISGMPRDGAQAEPHQLRRVRIERAKRTGIMA